MDTNRFCPGCQKPLPRDAPLGLCPECLVKAGFNTGAEPGSESTGFTPPPVEQIAKLFPQFEITGFIGKGGMGAVYKARQPGLDRFVALKILPPSVAAGPGFAERFNREARALARLTHPNIVTVHDFGQVGDLHYLVMEFVDGSNLREVERAGRLAPEQALAIVPQICDALQFAHGEGIVHRDIKPENILLDKKGRVKITDFGIAKILGQPLDKSSLTGAKDVVGTPHYMAPEQIEGPTLVDHRADIYSLGVVFYEMLTGELPLGKFQAPSKKVQVDVRLDEVVLHALEKEPERRYQQASQVKTAVETIAGSAAQFAAAPAAFAAANPPSGAGKITAPAVALMVGGFWKVLSAFSAVFFLTGGGGWLSRIPGLGSLGNVLGAWGPVAIFSIMLLKVVPGLLILFGGFQMLRRRSYAWAFAAGILSIISCSLIAFPIGIWALIVLAQEDVKSAFGSTTAPAAPISPQRDPFWRRFAVVAGCVILISIAIGVIGLLVLAVAIPNSLKGRQHSQEMGAGDLKQAGIREDAGGEFRKDSSQFFPLNPDGRFSLDHVKGRIEIHGWSSNAVVINTAIHGKTSESVEAVNINIDSNLEGASVHTDQPSRGTGFPWNWLWFNNNNVASVDYVIKVPQGARLSDIRSVNGHIEIDGISGDIAASTVNGETEIKDAARDLKLSTVNGRIRAAMIRLGGGQSVSLAAVNGDVELAVPDDAAASFSVSTVNGSISSEFPSLQPKTEFPIGNKLDGSLGGGGATVTAKAVNGSVRILKIQAAKQSLANPPAVMAGRVILEDEGQTVAGLPPVIVETQIRNQPQNLRDKSQIGAGQNLRLLVE